MRALLAYLVGSLARAWVSTLRVRVYGQRPIGPGVVGFFHGEQLALLKARPAGPCIAPISLSRDGRLQAQVMARFGVGSADGSTSRGAIRATRALLRQVQHGYTALVAVDGPRGPRGRVQPGAVYVAQKTGRPIWAARAQCRYALELKSSWDRFLLPLPFSVIEVYFSEPMRVDSRVATAVAVAEFQAMLNRLELKLASP